MSALIVMLASGSGTADPRISKEAQALVSAGFQVVVLAWDRRGAEPRLRANEGWRIESFGPRATHGGGLRNLPGYLNFWRQAARRVVELAPDAVHCHNLDTVPAALRAAGKLPGKPRLVLDFWEIYRESRALPQSGIIGGIARGAARLLERRSIPNADLVITVVPSQVAYYERLGARNVVVVENAPDSAFHRPGDRRDAEFTVCFIGQKRWTPSLVNLMRAIQPHPRIRALLVGGGPAEAEVAASAEAMERVEVAGRFSPEEKPALYARCDAVYACYGTSLLNWRTGFAVKAMEGMAAGLPLIVTKGTYSAEFVERHGLGYAVTDEVADIERALVALERDRDAARAMGLRGREIVERELNWAAAAARLTTAYQELFTDTATFQ